MADNQNESGKDGVKKSGLGKKFAIAAGTLVLAAGVATGAAIGVNGIQKGTAEGLAPSGPATLHTMTIKPVFERQTYDTPNSHYWCWSVASIKCPIPVSESDKPAYDQMKANQQYKK